LVALLPERKRQFAKPPLDAIRLNVREVLTVYPRCALVGAALGISMGQNVVTANLVVQVSRDNLDENGATIWMRRGSRAEG
jgi:hypothetical protein